MSDAFWTDHPILKAEEDRFDFQDYAEALSQIVLSGSTPITIGVFGPWGAGKTSLMRLISKYLTGRRTAEHRRAHVIWFNAWQYERDEGAIWRALLLRVLECLKGLELSPPHKQRIEDWETRLYADVDRTEKGEVSVDWKKLGQGALTLGLSLSSLSGGLLEVLKLAEGKMSTLEEVVEAVSHEEIKIRRRKLSLLEEFRSGFAEIVLQYVRKRNGLLIIFVDDLDRCLPDRALEVLETIKLFLDVPGCAFFLAADHERIETVVEQKYGSQEEGVGESYLEKLVQLPFYLPPLEEVQMKRFVARAAPDLPPEVHQIFACGLPPNPRLIKRILNIFRLLQQLAARRIARGKMVAIEPALLAKMVVIQGRYRDLYQDLLEYPNLIQDLEMRARGDEEKQAPPLIPGMQAAPLLIEKYESRRPLMRMLRIPVSFSSLSAMEIGSYLHLTLPTGQEPNVRLDPNQRLWEDLLSGDLTRIRAAVREVRGSGEQPEMTARYAKALLKIFLGEREATFQQRLSAGWALGYLEDPRDFDVTVTIPAGKFPYGEEALPYYLLPYRITRYLVTNRQYAAFLRAHSSVPAPYVEAAWANAYNWDREQRTYPPGKGNFPVVLVTWSEARDYCAWVGGRLPTQEEWERAARGLDGRMYPWGNSFDMRKANTRESGLGGPTPVGLFIEGLSPEGLSDAAGNVWEWTSSDYNLKTKVLRGGAWSFAAESARVFASERSLPHNRSAAIGFRVAFAAENADKSQK
jgi:formylglycine-generating enzyme required for sulfatase activity